MKKLIFLSFLFFMQSNWEMQAQKQKTLSQTTEIVSGNIYKIVSKATNKSLDVSNSSLSNSANIDTWADTNSDAQKWIVTAVSNQRYTFTNVASGKLLHIAVSKPSNNVNVDQINTMDNNYVKWAITPLANGCFNIQTTVDLSYCLTEVTSKLVDGANVNLYITTGSDNQSWSFVLQTPQDSPPTPAVADQVYTAWLSKYYDNNRTGNEVIAREGFWGVAEMMEIVDDAYEVTGYYKYSNLFNAMYQKFIAKESSDWMWNEFNDDITWMVIACTRASLLTGNTTYQIKAKEQFDKMYARANTNGGGLTWKQGTVGINSCINGPAMVACCYLAQATGDKTYYDKAIALYNWSKNKLFYPASGKVNDGYKDGVISSWSSTYNQGTYLGAALMLYNYTKENSYLLEAQRIAQYTQVTMANNGVFNGENGQDLDGFKGILQRYTRRYVVDLNKSDYIPWLQLNAKVAYNNRNSEGLIYTRWGTRTIETSTLNIDTVFKYVPAFAASTAVSLLINCPYSTTLVKSAYNTIEAEDFNYLKGITVETNVDGTKNISNVKTGFYTAYYNVDFGFKGSESIEFQLSSIQEGNTIEIRMGSVTGNLIGTVIIPNTTSWSTFATITSPVSNVKGLQNVYFVYKGSNIIGKINNFKFIESSEAPISNGLMGTYYSGIDFKTQLLQRIDNTINFNWAEFSPAAEIPVDNISVRWTGLIQPLYTGEYTFYITSGNGRRVWVNNQLIIDKWLNDGGITYSGTINLVANEKYDIKVEYFASTGNADIKLEWQNAQQVREVIPASQLFMPDLTLSTLVENHVTLENILIYPSTEGTKVTINTESINAVQVSIYDIQGILLIQSNERFSGEKTFDVSKLSKGMYFAIVLSDNGAKKSLKFLK